jgi:3-hydroxyisobutyrate dehydrogenase
MRVAVLGTGIIGSALARVLVRARHEVRAWHRTRAKAEPLATDGVTAVDTVAETIDGPDVVRMTLADGRAIQTVMDPMAGELGDAVRGQTSTVGVKPIERLAALADRADATMVSSARHVWNQSAAVDCERRVCLGPRDRRSDHRVG